MDNTTDDFFLKASESLSKIFGIIVWMISMSYYTKNDKELRILNPSKIRTTILDQ